MFIVQSSLFNGHCLLLFLVRRVRRRPTQKERSAVGKREFSSVGATCSIFGSVTIDHDLGARQQCLFGKAAPEQDVRRARFNRPLLDASIRLLHVEMNPHVGIHLDVKQPDGSVEKWSVEAGTPNVLFRRGFTKQALLPGTEIVVDGYRSKDGTRRAN